MSIVSRPESGSPPWTIADTSTVPDVAGLTTRYLTDGVNL